MIDKLSIREGLGINMTSRRATVLVLCGLYKENTEQFEVQVRDIYGLTSGGPPTFDRVAAHSFNLDA